MKNDTDIIATLAIACVILFISSMLFMILAVNYENKLAPMEAAVKKCEETLTRNQHCKLIYSAEVVK
jgi:hypothetical protein